MKQIHYFIDQTTRGSSVRLTLDFTSKVEAQIACDDLSIAYPKSTFEVSQPVQIIKQPELKENEN